MAEKDHLSADCMEDSTVNDNIPRSIAFRQQSFQSGFEYIPIQQTPRTWWRERMSAHARWRAAQPSSADHFIVVSQGAGHPRSKRP
jgi:hypothetical protein